MMGTDQDSLTATRGTSVKTMILFFLLATVLNLAIWFGSDYLKPYNVFIATLVTGLMHLSGLQAVQAGAVISISNNTWIVSTECNALYLMAIFGSFIVAYPSPLRDKISALLLGPPLIFAANIARLYAMAWIDRLRPDFSGYFHNYVWQVAFIIMIVFFWTIWTDRISAREAKDSVSD